MGDRVEDIQQRTTGRIRTRVTAVRTEPSGVRSLPSEPFEEKKMLYPLVNVSSFFRIHNIITYIIIYNIYHICSVEGCVLFMKSYRPGNTAEEGDNA